MGASEDARARVEAAVDKEAAGSLLKRRRITRQAAPPAPLPPPVAKYELGQRVVYTPARGRAQLATVRFAGDPGSRPEYGIETDEVLPDLHDGTHPQSGQRHFTCESGRGLYLHAGSARLRSAELRATPAPEAAARGQDAQSRLLQGLEAMSEQDAIRLSRLRRLAESALRWGSDASSEQEFRKCWDRDSRRYLFFERGMPDARGRPSLPRSGSVSSVEGGPEAAALEDGASYCGPRLPQLGEGHLTPEEAAALFRHCAANWRSPLPCSLLLSLVQAARALLLRESSVQRLRTPPSGRLVIVGDTHGHLKDLVHIWKTEGLPSPETQYLFNGDICDRGDSDRRGGQQALHIWACVLGFKVAAPRAIWVNRGNHEDSAYWTEYGPASFSSEIEAKYSRKEADQLIDAFAALCESLPLAAVVDESCLVVHGGLPRCWHGKGAVRLHEIEAVKRPAHLPSSAATRPDQILYDIAWADPQEEKGIGTSTRGGDVVCFGPDVTKSFLQAEGLKLLIRSHEVPGRLTEFAGRGFEWWHPLTDGVCELLGPEQKGWCLTVFSASDYCGCNETNAASRVVFWGGGGGFEIVEHKGSDAERSFLESSAAGPASPVGAAQLCEQRSLSQAVLDRSVVEAIVEHKHRLLGEFVAMDAHHDWFLEVEKWVTCCYRVLPLIPWEDYLDEPSIVPMQDGKVCYTIFLTRYQIQMRNKLGLHAGFRRRLTDQLFEGLLRADLTIRETLRAVDLDGDGRVSMEEFASALSRFGKVLTPEQAKTLYRTTIVPQGSIQVEDFLGSVSLHFALTHPRPTTSETDFVPARLDAICRDILDREGGPWASQSLAVLLRQFFERADTRKDGYLEPEEFVSAIRPLKSCAGLTEAQLEAIGRYIDLNGDQRINYAELLNALCVRHTDDGDPHTKGPKALLEDMLEAVHRILHFEYARPLRTLLRRLSPLGCTRCTTAKFGKALTVLNSCSGAGLLSEHQILGLVETLDVDVRGDESEGHFDFEDFFNSFRIVDTLAGEDADADAVAAAA